jgi:peptide/nickel transport system substrate-binding protein
MLAFPAARSVTSIASQPQSDATLTEWTIPTINSGPWALTLDPSGHCCWFLEYYGDKIAHFDPSNNTFQEWTIPTPQANPYALTTTIIDGSLVLWGTEFGADKIFSFSPSTGSFLEYSLTEFGTGSLGVGYISSEPTNTQVRVWFTETSVNINSELIFDPKTSNITLYQDVFPLPVGGGAYDVYAGSNSVWFAGISAIVRWDRASQQYTIWPLPVHGQAVGRFISVDQYGQVWYTEGVTDGNSTYNYAGVLRENSTFQEWHIANPGADPRGITINPLTQQPWIAEQSPTVQNGTIAMLDPSTGGTLIPSTPIMIPSHATPTILAPLQSQATVEATTVNPTTRPIANSVNSPFSEYLLGPSQPHDSVVDSSGNIWISEPKTNKIAKLTLSPNFSLTTSPPTISLPKGSSGSVTVSGTSISNFAGSITLSIQNLPPGITVSSFTQNPLSIKPGTSNQSQFNVDIGTNAPNGTSELMIQGTDNNITQTTTLLIMIMNSTAEMTPSHCLIATATYGSELSPEVQLLRNFRDNSLAKSYLGSSFLIIFNAWYYSFSPNVAQYLDTHVIPRYLMRVVLYPSIQFFRVASQLYAELHVYPELATVVSGTVASFLLGAFYIGIPLGLITRKLNRKLSIKIWYFILLCGLSTILLGEMLTSAFLLMISSSITVLATVFASAISTATLISKRSLKIKNKHEYADPT